MTQTKISFKEQIIDTTSKAKATRQAFGEVLAELGGLNKDIVVLDADLSKSTKTELFAAKYPDRFFNMGIAEANMIGAAAGLAMAGKIPFAASFGCFLTGRFDQIRMSVSFSGANVRLVGTHAGVAIGEDGHSQMALEDLTLMRCLPNMTVFQPADEKDTRHFIEWSLKHNGPCYLRLTRQNLPALKHLGEESFGPGKWGRLTPLPEKEGVVLIGTGGVLEPLMDAADIISSKIRNGVGLVNANWIKPLDEGLLMQLAESKPSLVVTAEDHYTTGGLGSGVVEFFADRGLNVRVLRLGVQEFGQSGSPEANYEHYGFTGTKLSDRILKELNYK